jgi:hypothetical protein
MRLLLLLTCAAPVTVATAQWAAADMPWFDDLFVDRAACADPAGPCTTAGVPSTVAAEQLLAYAQPFVSCSSLPIRFPPKRRSVDFTVVDVTTVAYDLDILEIRLFELAPIVDVFVVIESTHTQRGDRKPLFFNRSRFRSLRDRIRYVTHAGKAGPLRPNATPFDGENWLNENAPRDQILAAVAAVAAKQPRQPIVVHSGDADEFLSRDALAAVRPAAMGTSAVCGATSVSYINAVVTRPDIEPRKRAGQVATVWKWPRAAVPFHSCDAFVPGVSFHLSGFLSPVGHLLKEVSHCEGGGVMNRHASGPSRVADPCGLLPLTSTGVRPCCADAPRQPSTPTEPLPLLLATNVARSRYPHLFGASSPCICN